MHSPSATSLRKMQESLNKRNKKRRFSFFSKADIEEANPEIVLKDIIEHREG